MAPPTSILSVGLTAPPDIQARLDAGYNQASAAGYDIEMIHLRIADFPPELEKLKEKLRSKHYDGFMVGFGVRGKPELTDVFESLVNAASEALPGVKFGFSGSPDDLFDCVVRNFGEKK